MSIFSAKYWRFWLGLLISVVFLYLALRNVQWQDVLEAWRTAHLFPLLIGLVLLVAGWVVSAVRWRIILSPAPGLTVRDTFAYITIGYLANTVLPLRLGELARVTLIGRQRNLGISRSLGSVAMERVLDLLTLVLFVLVLTVLMEMPPVIQAGLVTMAASALVLLTGLIVLAFHQERLQRLLTWLDRYVPRGLARRAAQLLENFSEGVRVIRSPVRLAGVFLLSLAAWTLGGCAVINWIGAFNLPAPWLAGFFVLVVINLGSAIPSSPAYIGVYHGLAVWALSVWGVDKGPALAYAFGTHALIMLANVALGSFYLTREGISLKAIRGAEAGGA